MNPLLLGDFNTPVSKMDIPSRQNISKDVAEFNKISNHLDIMGIYTLLYPTTA